MSQLSKQIVALDLELHYDQWLYLIDADGDIARSCRSGQKITPRLAKNPETLQQTA
jgi:hypothetical protein